MSFNNRKNNGKSYRNNNHNFKNQQNTNSNICDICKKEPFKYKCSKCKSQTVKICSMSCYKAHNENGEHFELSQPTVEPTKEEIKVEQPSEFAYLLENEKIQSLLKYNTVKYHLHKVYQLLQLDHSSIQEDTINNRKDLEECIARYLSCFRENGIYKNVAIEEFVQTCLKEMDKHTDEKETEV